MCSVLLLLRTLKLQSQHGCKNKERATCVGQGLHCNLDHSWEQWSFFSLSMCLKAFHDVDVFRSYKLLASIMKANWCGIRLWAS